LASQSTKGSELLAQQFKGPQWFHPRASAAKYDPKAFAVTNAAVASKEYIQTVKDNMNQLKKEKGNLGDTIPPDLLTTSCTGSGRSNRKTYKETYQWTPVGGFW